MIHWTHLLWMIPLAVTIGVCIAALLFAAHDD